MMGAAYPIGFIGLGTMGEAMALTLVKAVHGCLSGIAPPQKLRPSRRPARMLLKRRLTCSRTPQLLS